jgi:transposase
MSPLQIHSVNLINRQIEQLNRIKLSGSRLKRIRALQIRESFQDTYQAPTKASFVFLLKKWYFWASHSRLEPMIVTAKTIKSHWDGVWPGRGPSKQWDP